MAQVKISDLTADTAPADAAEVEIETGGAGKKATLANLVKSARVKDKMDATVAPGATDDSAAGYAVGSKWVDVTADKAYICVDATATAAVWTEITQAAGGLPVDDTTALVRDPADNTKLVRMDAGAVATATTRVLTMADQDIDLTPASGAFASAAQGATADAALPKAGGQMSGNITMAGAETVDGRDLSADGAKLDGIATGAIANVVEDPTPQWGGNVDMNAKALTEEFTAGEAVADGDLCYLKSDGKFWKADADAAATADGMLAMCTATIAADATGTFLVYGRYTTTGLTAGSTYYVSTTLAGITATAPSAAADIVRIVGHALSTTVLFFNPDQTYLEIA